MLLWLREVMRENSSARPTEQYRSRRGRSGGQIQEEHEPWQASTSQQIVHRPETMARK